MVHESMRVIIDEHSALSAMLRSLIMMMDRGPLDDRDQFFDVLRAMLFYVDEFPERLHHPKGGCKKFCVNGLLAGNCRLAWNNDDRRTKTPTHRTDRRTAGGLQEA